MYVLTASQVALCKADFTQGKIILFSELILTPPSDISRRSKRPLSDIEDIIENACKEYSSTACVFTRLEDATAHKFTTGDAHLDNILGGGIRTGMVWEIAGERYAHVLCHPYIDSEYCCSASGKTQFALQLSLLVQLRPLLGGLSGSACYITTYSKLATKRLSQLTEEHPLLSPSVCSLSDVHTAFAPTAELLVRILKQDIPALQEKITQDDSRKPIRLVIVDSLSSIFQANEKSPASALFERSKVLTELSHIMHTFAARNDIAFLVINGVTDVFTENAMPLYEPGGEVIYRNQARWFNSAHSMPGENTKEASLGLVWANQVNVRIMLSKTQRRRHLEVSTQVTLGKRRRMDDVPSPLNPSDSDATGSMSVHTDQPTLLRRLTVIYNSVASPDSVDFVITKEGISVIPAEGHQGKPIDPDSRHLDTLPKESFNTESKELVSQIDSIHEHRIEEMPLGSAQFTSALSVKMDHSLDISTEPGTEVIPSTFPEEEDVLDIDDAIWEEFDDVVDPLINGPDPEALDNFFSSLEAGNTER